MIQKAERAGQYQDSLLKLSDALPPTLVRLTMDTTLQAVITKEPETRKNWTNFEIDCEVKYILHFMNRRNFEVARQHIDKVKGLLDSHVDPVFWLNVQLIQLQYYDKTKEYDKSIVRIKHDVAKSALCFNIINSPFATL